MSRIRVPKAVLGGGAIRPGGSGGIFGGGGGRASIEIVIAADTPTHNSIPVSLVNPPAGLQTWTLEYKIAGAPDWSEYATGLTGTTQTIADLDPEETYQFRAIADVLVEATSNTGSATTLEAQNLQVNRVSSIGAAYENGMLNAVGNPLPEGDIVSATGRTFAGQFNVTTWHQANARTRRVDAVRFLLWNQRNVPISGGKLIVGWSDDNPEIMGQGNSPTALYNEPSVGGTLYNAVTGNARQGWKRATIGGNPLLPVPAADATKEGAAWTDWIEFNAIVLNFNRLYWRFWHPGMDTAETDYALTYFSYDPAPSYGSGYAGTIQGDSLRYDDGWKYAGPSPWDFYTSIMFDNSDLVEDPAAKTVAEAFNGRFGPAANYIGEPMYVPPGPTVRPWIAAEFREAA